MSDTSKHFAIDSNGNLLFEIKSESPTYLPNSDLIKIRQHDKVGAIDCNGKLVLPAIYRYIGYFATSRDVANIVSENLQMGFVDIKGNVVTPCEFDFNKYISLNFTHDNVMIVLKNNKLGIVDHQGYIIVPCVYDDFYPSSDKELFSSKKLVCAKLEGKWGFINKSNETIIPFEYDEVRVIDKQGFAIVIKDGKFGVITDTATIIPCEYEKIISNECSIGSIDGQCDSLFSAEGYIPVKLNEKWGFRNTNGHVIPCVYESVESFRNGFAKVEANGKWGVINSSGQLIIPCQYSTGLRGSVINMINQDGSFWKICTKYRLGGNFKESRYQIIDTNRKITTSSYFCRIGYFNANNYLPVCKSGKWGVLDSSLNEIIPYKYDAIEDFGQNGLLLICESGKWGLLDSSLNEIIPCKYDAIEDFGQHGFVLICESGRWGLLDSSLNEIIPCKYDAIEDFGQHGFLLICESGRWGLLDSSLNEITPCKYDLIEKFNDEGFAKVRLYSFYGVINLGGKEIINCAYCQIGEISPKFPISARIDEIMINPEANYGVTKCGYIDINGKTIIPFKYKNASDFSPNGIAIVTSY